MCEEINEFESISPYSDKEAVEALGKLADHPAVIEVSKAIFPDKPKEYLREVLKNLKSIDEFQTLVMSKAIEWVLDTSAHNFLTTESKISRRLTESSWRSLTIETSFWIRQLLR